MFCLRRYLRSLSLTWRYYRPDSIHAPSSSLSHRFLSVCGRHMKKIAFSELWRSTGLTVFLCAVPFTKPSETIPTVKRLETVDVPDLGHRSLLRNASSAVVTSASALVSQGLMTLNELNTAYIKEAYHLVTLFTEHSSITDQNLGILEDDLWQEIIESRAKLEENKRAMQEVESVLRSALTVLQSAGEAAYLAGVEYSVLEAKSKHQQATDYLSLIQSEARRADRELTKIQARGIKETPTQEKGEGS